MSMSWVIFLHNITIGSFDVINDCKRTVPSIEVNDSLPRVREIKALRIIG